MPAKTAFTEFLSKRYLVETYDTHHGCLRCWICNGGGTGEGEERGEV